MDAREIPDAIQWHEGLLLTPQHFQQLSWRPEALVQYSISLIAPFCWGIRHFKHDAISLPGGKLRVTELEAVMPDGLIVSHGLESAGRRTQLEVDIPKPTDDIADQIITIYLGVEMRQGGDGAGDLVRYQAHKGDAVAGDGAAGKAGEIHRLKPRLTLLVNTPATKYVSFPIARVIYNAPSFTLDDKFIPPVLAVPIQSAPGDVHASAAQRLGEMCSDSAQRVRTRAMHIADEARSPGTETRAASDIGTKNIMLGLIGALPYFEAVLNTGVSHPYQIYLALCSMAGHLAVLGSDVPDSFAPYNHNDLYASFKPLLDFIDRMMDQGVPLSYKTFPFEYHAGLFELQFKNDWTKKRLAIGLKAQRGMSDPEINKWGESCLIGSQSKLEDLRKNRITGAPRKRVEKAGDIVRSRGVTLFSLSADPNFVEPDEFLQIRNDEEGLRPTEIVLYVMDN
jgi:type VI secretion system protein ImpJ